MCHTSSQRLARYHEKYTNVPEHGGKNASNAIYRKHDISRYIETVLGQVLGSHLMIDILEDLI